MNQPNLLEADVLVVNQRAQLIELTNEYYIRDPDGNDVGVIRQENQSKARKLLRLVTKVDQFLSIQLGVYDAAGQRVLQITRPPAFLKSTLSVADGTGVEVGRIVQQNVIGKIRFALVTPDGAPVGEIRAENWRAWDFAILDPAEREMGRISKKWAGLGKELFTTADNYVFEVSRSDLPLHVRQLMLATAASIDTALKQDNG